MDNATRTVVSILAKCMVFFSETKVMSRFWFTVNIFVVVHANSQLPYQDGISKPSACKHS